MNTPVVPLTQLSDVVVAKVLPLDRNPFAVFLSEKVASTRYQYQLDLTQIVRLLGMDDPFAFPWHELRFQHTTMIRTLLMEYVSEKTDRPLAPVTMNRMLSALKGVLKTAYKLELMSTEDYYRAISIDTIRGESLPAGRELSTEEIVQLIETCRKDDTPAGVRDQAIIATMYSTGTRRSELVALNLGDYDRNTGKLKVRGKGHKERFTYVVGGAIYAMEDWLSVRGDEPGPLFVPIRKSGELIFRHLKPVSLYGILNKRADQAGLARFSPHRIRHLFVGDLLTAGADIGTVSKLCGHSNIQTTLLYDRRREETKKSAANLLHIPYKRRNGKG